jgi:hypothetical protein
MMAIGLSREIVRSEFRDEILKWKRVVTNVSRHITAHRIEMLLFKKTIVCLLPCW